MMADDPIREDLDALKADIATLRDDIVRLAATVQAAVEAQGEGMADEVRDQADRYREAFASRVDAAVGQGRKMAEELDAQVGQHPLGAMVAAFGLGFVVAKLLDLGGRR